MKIGRLLVFLIVSLSFLHFSPLQIHAEEDVEIIDEVNEVEVQNKQNCEEISEEATELDDIPSQPVETDCNDGDTEEDEADAAPENQGDQDGLDDNSGQIADEDNQEVSDVDETEGFQDDTDGTDTDTEETDADDQVSEPELETDEPEAEDEIEEADEEQVSKQKEDKPKIQASATKTTSVSSDYKQGNSDPVIADFKKKLNKIGFGGITVTNYYGDFTEKRVKQFQKEYGLSQTGTLNQATQNKINEIHNSPLQLGKRHNDLIDLKHKLNHLGFGKITVTNYFGNFSEKKVKQFQSSYSLPVSGIIDSKTKLTINDIFSSTYKEGGRNEQIKDFKRHLNKIGFGGITVTNYYGDFTTKRVKQFQEYYGLSVTGNADLKTLQKAEAVANTPLQEGKRNNNTTTLKKKLNKIGFGGITVTNLYGSYTTKRVKDFQRHYDLKVTGITEDITLAKINEIYNSPLQLGKSIKELANLKHMLNNLGYSGITVTNYYGAYTEKKVKQFQQDHQLPVSGIIDVVTKNTLESTFTSTYQIGGSNEQIKNVKRNLNSIGFGGILVTDYYGTFTKQRVEQFQGYYGLKVTGQADLTTLLKIEEVANSDFRQGKRSNKTLELKRNLNRLGFGNISVTTLYGTFTEKKVKDFQKYYGLKVNGIADPITLDKINELVNSPFQQGKRHNDTLQLKRDLNRIGFGNISVTTLYGSFTDKKVKEFQSYYGLVANGIVDNPTRAQIDVIINSPLQLGKSHNDLPGLKRNLNALGYSGITVTTYFGDFTEKRLKQFQKDFNLPVSGIADAKTIAAINTAIENMPKDRIEYTKYGLSLQQAAALQNGQQTDKYRNDPAYVSASYLELTGKAAINGTGVNIRTQPNTSSSIAYQATNGEAITVLGTVEGTEVSGSTDWIKFKNSSGNTYYVHSSLVAGKQAKVTATVNVRAGQGTNYHSFGKLTKGETVSIISEGSNWHQISYEAWRNASQADIIAYMDPSKNDEFQHLRLDTSIGLSAKELNKALVGKGILARLGQAFIDGGKKHNVNEAYLIAHAFLETGHGTSTLATGVKYNGKTVYNMFGIGAIDSDPLNGGARTAYENGWFTPEAAIIGGAKWIGDGYIHNQHQQNTLYKMKWNPNMADGYAWKQYATDIGWATKQTSQIRSIYEQLDNPQYHFDIAQY